VLSEAEGAKSTFYYTYRCDPFLPLIRCSSLTSFYSVYWEESSTPWATRWDNYLRVYDPKIHTFSLINSLVMVIFLCAIVSSLLLRSVKGDVRLFFWAFSLLSFGNFDVHCDTASSPATTPSIWTKTCKKTTAGSSSTEKSSVHQNRPFYSPFSLAMALSSVR
jgi:endomembrane protein 70